MKTFDFNINHKVFVKLTDTGRELLRIQHDELMSTLPKAARWNYKPKEENPDGWSEWQMGCLMKELGHACYIGRVMPFDTNIKVEMK